MAFELSLNTLTNPINEIESTKLSGLISGLKLPGGEVSLDINWGNSSSQLTLKDDGTGGDKVAGDGQIEFTFTQQYLDDNPTGTPSDTYNINVDAKENFLIGTDAVFVIDRSGSTGGQAQGLTAPVGDQNGDGFSNTILDVEISSFKALNQSLIDRGLGHISKVSSVQFDLSAQRLDMEPGTAGFQSFTTPLTDSDKNGILDVNQVLSSLTFGGQTNYEAALQQAISSVNAAGTPTGQGNVIFLSDGIPNRGGAYNDEANTIRNTEGQNLRAFGVGKGAALGPLQGIDPNAQVFIDPQDLLDVFGGAGAGSNQDSASASVTVNNVAPVVAATATSEINENGVVNLSGNFTDVGTQDTHNATVDWGDGTTEALTLNPDGTFNANHKYLDDGSFGTTPQNGTAFDNYIIQVSVVDDDKGVGTAKASTKVNDVAPVLSALDDNLPLLGIIVEGDTLEFSANYTDVGTKDFHTVDFDWGDGSPVNSSTKGPLAGGIGTANGSHVYSSAGAYTASLTVKDDDTLLSNSSIQVNVANKVDLDWKPGSNPSSMNFTGGTIPVAILGASDFNVSDIDVSSIKFDDEKDSLLNGGGVGVNIKNNGTYQFSFTDTNADGYTDLVAHVKATELGTVVRPNEDPFLTDGQIYALGEYDGNYFFGAQHLGDLIKILG